MIVILYFVIFLEWQVGQRSDIPQKKKTSFADSDESHVPSSSFSLLIIIAHPFRHSKQELTGNSHRGVRGLG